MAYKELKRVKVGVSTVTLSKRNNTYEVWISTDKLSYATKKKILSKFPYISKWYPDFKVAALTAVSNIKDKKRAERIYNRMKLILRQFKK